LTWQQRHRYKKLVVMFFQVYYKNPKAAKSDHLDWSSGNYPVGQTKTCDLSKFDNVLKEGAAVWIKVNAIAGLNKSSNKNTFVYSKDNGQTAKYEVKGMTLDYSINVIK
jgi:hypothetical protein